MWSEEILTHHIVSVTRDETAVSIFLKVLPFQTITSGKVKICFFYIQSGAAKWKRREVGVSVCRWRPIVSGPSSRGNLVVVHSGKLENSDRHVAEIT